MFTLKNSVRLHEIGYVQKKRMKCSSKIALKKIIIMKVV